MRNVIFIIMKSASVVKAFALLEAVAGTPQGLALGDLASRINLNKPTAHRILKTLMAIGYVEKSSFGHYRQTAQVHRLVGVAEERRLIDAAAPHIRKLHQKTKETVNLGVLRSGRIVYLEVLESSHPLRRVATPNSVDPFHSTALGRAIVAFLPEPQRELLLASVPLEARTAHTIIEPEKLRCELNRVAEQGHAIEIDQTDLGVTCVAAAIFEGGAPAGAISISVPSARFDSTAEKALLLALRAAVQRVERELRRVKELVK